MAISVDILDEHEAWAIVPDRAAIANRIVATAALFGGIDIPAEGEVSLLFCDDARIQDLNRIWRGQDKPTNVLSFPAPRQNEFDKSLGDIAIAFETVAREAASEGKTMADHTAHLIAHGFLHLIGFDHETEAEAEIMEAKEIAILAAHGVADPYGADAEQRLST